MVRAMPKLSSLLEPWHGLHLQVHRLHPHTAQTERTSTSAQSQIPYSLQLLWAWPQAVSLVPAVTIQEVGLVECWVQAHLVVVVPVAFQALRSELQPLEMKRPASPNPVVSLAQTSSISVVES